MGFFKDILNPKKKKFSKNYDYGSQGILMLGCFLVGVLIGTNIGMNIQK